MSGRFLILSLVETRLWKCFLPGPLTATSGASESQLQCPGLAGLPGELPLSHCAHGSRAQKRWAQSPHHWGQFGKGITGHPALVCVAAKTRRLEPSSSCGRCIMSELGRDPAKPCLRRDLAAGGVSAQPRRASRVQEAEATAGLPR